MESIHLILTATALLVAPFAYTMKEKTRNNIRKTTSAPTISYHDIDTHETAWLIRKTKAFGSHPTLNRKESKNLYYRLESKFYDIATSDGLGRES